MRATRDILSSNIKKESKVRIYELFIIYVHINSKLFIPNYKDTKDKTVRERYGVVMSIFCIVCNCILVVFKLIVSFISNSLSIRADALNNLSDMGSNIASLLGFKVASKHPDSEHPYGHGRAEYVSGLIIGF